MPTIYSDKETLNNLPERRAFDFYSTDPAVCDRALYHLARLYPNRTFSRIVDAGAGTGVWGFAARRRFPDCHLTGVELRETPPPFQEGRSLDHNPFILSDDLGNSYSTVDMKLGTMPFNRWFSGKSYLKSYGYNDRIKGKEATAWDTPTIIDQHDADLVIGNPPYNLAEDFVVYSLENVLNTTGVICMLLQASFLWGEKRYERVNSKYPPKEVIVRKRVSFTGNGKTNGDDYAYYFWEKGYEGRTMIDWDYPAKERSVK